MDTKKILILAGVILFVMLAGAAAILATTNQQTAQSPPPETRYTGNMVCLPHKNAAPGQPQTLECAIGIKTIEGKYYGLKDMPETSQNVEFTTSITVTGDLEQPASNEKYDTLGTIKVKTFQAN
jgi:hypothetical protein